MNSQLFRLINNLAYKNAVLDKAMIFFSKDALYIFLLIGALVFITGIVQKDTGCRKVVAGTFVFTVINLLIGAVIGHIYFINRPFVHSKVNLLVPHAEDASFPSDHATGTMSIASGFAKYNKILSAFLIILSLIVGFSRVYVGNHYPSDVIGAYIMVFITGFIYKLTLRTRVENLYEKLERKIASAFGITTLYKRV